jgi:hypothetical protein
VPLTERPPRPARTSGVTAQGPQQVYLGSQDSPSSAKGGGIRTDGRQAGHRGPDQQRQTSTTDVRIVAVVRITRNVVTLRAFRGAARLYLARSNADTTRCSRTGAQHDATSGRYPVVSPATHRRTRRARTPEAVGGARSHSTWVTAEVRVFMAEQAGPRSPRPSRPATGSASRGSSRSPRCCTRSGRLVRGPRDGPRRLRGGRGRRPRAARAGAAARGAAGPLYRRVAWILDHCGPVPWDRNRDVLGAGPRNHHRDRELWHQR